MEFVPFTTEQFSYLAKQDPYLAPFLQEYLQPMNYRDYQNNGKKELTSSTPTPSTRISLVGYFHQGSKHTGFHKCI